MMPIKIDWVGSGIPNEESAPKHMQFLIRALEMIDRTLRTTRKEHWDTVGIVKFTPLQIMEEIDWPELPTVEMLEEVKAEYEKLDRDWIGNIQVAPGRGPVPTLLIFRNPAVFRPKAQSGEVKLDRAAAIAAGLGDSPREGFSDDGS